MQSTQQPLIVCGLVHCQEYACNTNGHSVRARAILSIANSTYDCHVPWHAPLSNGHGCVGLLLYLLHALHISRVSETARHWTDMSPTHKCSAKGTWGSSWSTSTKWAHHPHRMTLLSNTISHANQNTLSTQHLTSAVADDGKGS
eukprot:2816443-Amphidinium_carterae.1